MAVGEGRGVGRGHRRPRQMKIPFYRETAAAVAVPNKKKDRVSRIALHCTTLHCIALHCTRLQYSFEKGKRGTQIWFRNIYWKFNYRISFLWFSSIWGELFSSRRLFGWLRLILGVVETKFQKQIWLKQIFRYILRNKFYMKYLHL